MQHDRAGGTMLGLPLKECESPGLQRKGARTARLRCHSGKFQHPPASLIVTHGHTELYAL